MKQIGVLCHVSSLPSKFGIGDFGKSSFDFIDFLSSNNFQLWQILPLNPTNNFNCPYSSHCSFAFDEMFIDVQPFINNQTIQANDIKKLFKVSATAKVAYTVVKQEKSKIIDKIFNSLNLLEIEKIKNEIKKSKWLGDYAYFTVVLKTFKEQDFRKIDKNLWDKQNTKHKVFKKDHMKQILRCAFGQLLLLSQWKKVKEYAHSKRIKIIGDLPIYPAPNSFDVFYFNNLFKLDKKTMNPLVYGGVPADDFCKDGQNWGTCVYDWKKLEIANYSFLINKIKHCLQTYDILRLDHFFGYVQHYEWNALNPKVGKWVKTNAKNFFNTLHKHIDFNNIIIEDLGFQLPSAKKIKNQFNLCGMAVMQMALNNPQNNIYLPQNVSTNNIYYLGTHDNNTFMGFLKGLTYQKKEEFCTAIECKSMNNKKILIHAMNCAVNSKCERVILTLQDLLVQDEKSRMNTPGRAEGCWEYKAPANYKNKARKLIDKLTKF